MLGEIEIEIEIEIEEWKCLAELIDNAFDDFNEIMIFIILEAAARRCRFSLCASIASATELNAFAIAVAGCPLLALVWRCCCRSNCSAVL